MQKFRLYFRIYCAKISRNFLDQNLNFYRTTGKHWSQQKSIFVINQKPTHIRKHTTVLDIRIYVKKVLSENGKITSKIQTLNIVVHDKDLYIYLMSFKI
jgi:hypothetical protein